MRHILKSFKKMRKLGGFEIIYISLLVLPIKHNALAKSELPFSNVIINIYVDSEFSSK